MQLAASCLSDGGKPSRTVRPRRRGATSGQSVAALVPAGHARAHPTAAGAPAASPDAATRRACPRRTDPQDGYLPNEGTPRGMSVSQWRSVSMRDTARPTPIAMIVNRTMNRAERAWLMRPSLR